MCTCVYSVLCVKHCIQTLHKYMQENASSKVLISCTRCVYMSHSLVVTLYIYMSDEWMSLVLSSLLVHSDHFVPMQEIVFFSKNCRALRPISVISYMYVRQFTACVCRNMHDARICTMVTRLHIQCNKSLAVVHVLYA